MSENFEKLELTPRNVYRIMKCCKKSERSKNVIETNFYAPGVEKKAPKLPFDADQLASWRPSILYLLGQLLPVHKWQATMEPAMASYNYHKKDWTEKDNLALFSLFYLGVATGCMPPFEQNTEGKSVSSIGTAKELKPTFSPSEILSKAELDYRVGLAAHDAEKYSAALEYFEKAAEQGHSNAQFNCGVMYYKGEGGEVNLPKALYWCTQSAQQGHKEAQLWCGVMYDEGKGTHMDKAKALYWYEKAAEQGVAIAQKKCGDSYYYGIGTNEDKDKAREWYQKAADQKNEMAQLMLLIDQGTIWSALDGAIKANGQGNYKKALELFQKAAQLGDAIAARECGKMYYKGSGTPVDKKKALEYFLQSAERNDPDAQFLCGLMYYYGEGVSSNRAVAKEWLTKAAHQDDAEAKVFLRQHF